MRCALIVAVAENRVIGKDNQIPWHIPADLKYFKKITMGKPLVMGRKTFESLGKPLPGRSHIVITRDQQFRYLGVTIAHSIDEALAIAQTTAESLGLQEFMVIGGAEIYRAVLPKVERMYLTNVHMAVEGDAFFPEYDVQQWHEVSREDFEQQLDSPGYSFRVLDRNPSAI